MSELASLNTSTDHPQGGSMAWFVCITGGLFFFYEFFQLNLFDVVNQSLRETFHLDSAQLSYMSSTYLLANLIFLLPAGILLDRFSVRKIILCTMSICIIGTIGFALTNSFAWASFFHFLSGIGNAFCFLSSIVLVSRWFPPNKQAFVIGCIVTLAFLGGMLAHTPLVLLNEHVGWRNSLQIDGGVGIIILVLLYFLVKDQPTTNTTKNSKQHPPIFQSFMRALSNKQTFLPALYTSCLNLPIMVLGALWGISYLQAEHHISSLAASQVISFVFIGSIVGCPLFGWLSDQQGRRKPVMLVGILGTLLAFLPLFLNIPLSIEALCILFFTIGLFTSTQVVSYPLIAESNNPEITGAATGIASLIIMGGAAVAQVLFGWLLSHQDTNINISHTVPNFHFAMWLFPITTLLALAALILTKETYCQHKNQGVFNGAD